MSDLPSRGGQEIVLCCDSVTKLDESARGKVVVTGSHGGVLPATLVANVRARGAVFNDASIGRDGAGVAGLSLLDQLGIPAAAVDYRSAVIGDGESTLHGKLSTVNQRAEEIGCSEGSTILEAISHFMSAEAMPTLPPLPAPPPYATARKRTRYAELDVQLLDSASLISQVDRRKLVVTGSHGGLVGRSSLSVIWSGVAGAVFNDAGRGPRERGVSRLTALATLGVPAATVDARSARIGDASSTWNDGVISVLNEPALRSSVESGASVRDFTRAIARTRS